MENIRGSSREERREAKDARTTVREGREVREVREVREPLSKQLARNLRSSFNDDNRTPSPDNTMVRSSVIAFIHSPDTRKPNLENWFQNVQLWPCLVSLLMLFLK